MGVPLKDLAEIARAELRGDPERVIERVATLKDAGEGAVSFLANPRYKAYLKTTRASAVILAAADAGDCPVDCLVADNPYLAHARVMTALYPPSQHAAGIHPSACVDPSAQVAVSAVVAANCFIGAGSVIEDGVVIGPGCTLLENVFVGADSRLVATVTLCADTRLGRRCLIHPGAVIGGVIAYLIAWFIMPARDGQTLQPAASS